MERALEGKGFLAALGMTNTLVLFDIEFIL
jgi:hypothetical protein